VRIDQEEEVVLFDVEEGSGERLNEFLNKID